MHRPFSPLAALVGVYPIYFADHGNYLPNRSGTPPDLEEVTGRPEPLDRKLEEWADRYSTVADTDDHGKRVGLGSPETLAGNNDALLFFGIGKHLSGQRR